MKKTILAMCTMVLAALLIPAPTPHIAAQSPTSSYTVTDCPEDMNYPANREVECGTLTVPENRSDPNSNTIELAVFIVRARQADTVSDPLVYLAGGPGGSTSNSVNFFEFAYGPYALQRDVILMDQRGTGLSEPRLDCNGYGQANFQAYTGGFSLEEGAQLAADALLECYDFYINQGIDMSAYTSEENAADFEDLRVALGIEQWNLYGISYGTRLALTIMRDHPEGVRSAVIDSVVPPSARLYIETPLNGAAALERLFELCAEDFVCNQAYPNLREQFYTVVDRLNAEPKEVEVRRPRDGRFYTAVLNGDTLVGAMFFNMYSTGAIQRLPYVINTLYQDIDLIGTLRQDFLPAYFAWDGIATAMHYSVNCYEEIAFDSFTEIEAAADTLDPRLQFFYDMDNYITYYICEDWERPTPDPIEIAPVVSDIPTLILTGELDPITPPRWGEQAAETLPNSTVIMVPNAGHGVTFAFDCPRDLMRRFIDDPTARLDTSCLREIAAPTFYVDTE